MSKKAVLPVLLLAVVWGGYYVASQRTVSCLSVFTAGFAIRFVTWLFLTAMMAVKKELSLLKQVRYVLFPLILIGIMGFLLDATAFIGLSMGSAATGTALLKTDVLMVSLISVLVYKMRFSLKQWLCTIVMLVGVLLVIGINPNELELANWGNIFFLLSAFFVSVNAFIIKHVQHHPKNPVCDDVVAYYNNFICMLLFLAASIFSGRLGELERLRADVDLQEMLLFASIGQTVVYILYYYNLRRLPVWFVKVFLLLMPIVSTLLCYILFDEELNMMQYVGMAVILLGAAGILLEQRTTPKDNRDHEFHMKKEESI